MMLTSLAFFAPLPYKTPLSGRVISLSPGVPARGFVFPMSERRNSASEIVQRVALLEAEITTLRALLKRMKAENDSGYDEAVA